MISGGSRNYDDACLPVAHPEIKQGPLKLASPDEETGTGATHFDVTDFGADFAYTVDGGPLGELEYETFNAAGQSTIEGRTSHCDRQGRHSNALGTMVAAMLPCMIGQKKRLAEKAFHLYQLDGTVDHARMLYLIQDHDRQMFEARKQALQAVVTDLNEQLGNQRVTLQLTDQYYNLKDALKAIWTWLSWRNGDERWRLNR